MERNFEGLSRISEDHAYVVFTLIKGDNANSNVTNLHKT